MLKLYTSCLVGSGSFVDRLRNGVSPSRPCRNTMKGCSARRGYHRVGHKPQPFRFVADDGSDQGAMVKNKPDKAHQRRNILPAPERNGTSRQAFAPRPLRPSRIYRAFRFAGIPHHGGTEDAESVNEGNAGSKISIFIRYQRGYAERMILLRVLRAFVVNFLRIVLFLHRFRKLRRIGNRCNLFRFSARPCVCAVTSVETMRRQPYTKRL
jgi:hypothetical protein